MIRARLDQAGHGLSANPNLVEFGKAESYPNKPI
jgi:hypothetical protein